MPKEKVNHIPEATDAEMAILGCVFLDPNKIIEIIDELKVDDFYDIKNQYIYKSMVNLALTNKTIDVTTVIHDLQMLNVFEKAGGPEYLSLIAEREYTPYNLESYVELVLNASVKRKAIKVLEDLYQAGFDSNVSTEDYIDYVERQVFELSKNRKADSFDKIGDVSKKVLETIETNSKRQGNLVGLDTGFEHLNRITQGFQKGQLIILAARPAMGKSAFALNLLENVCKFNGNATVAMFALEMPAQQLVERMIASSTSIGLSNVRSGAIQDTEWGRVQRTVNAFNNVNIYFDDASDSTISKIRAKCRKLKADDKLDFVVVDYLQLINSDDTGRNDNESIRVQRISRSLKLMARELEIPVLALSQLSRNIEKQEDKRPGLSDLRDSGAIEQDADIVMFIYRDEIYNKHTDKKGEAEVLIRKNRAGQTGVVLFDFIGQYQKFIEKKDQQYNVKEE